MDPFAPVQPTAIVFGARVDALVRQISYELTHQPDFSPPPAALIPFLPKAQRIESVTVIEGTGGTTPVVITTGKHDGLIMGGGVGFIN